MKEKAIARLFKSEFLLAHLARGEPTRQRAAHLRMVVHRVAWLEQGMNVFPQIWDSRKRGGLL
jgi:hypothetical protein